MTKVIIIDPESEIIIHSISIESKQIAKRVDQFWKDQEESRGHELERLLVRGGTVEIMDRTAAVPVPVYAALVRPG